MTVSEIIKQMRKQTGLSQNKFGVVLGIPVANIQKWEQGTSTPPEYVVRLIIRDLYRQGLIDNMDVIDKMGD